MIDYMVHLFSVAYNGKNYYRTFMKTSRKTIIAKEVPYEYTERLSIEEDAETVRLVEHRVRFDMNGEEGVFEDISPMDAFVFDKAEGHVSMFRNPNGFIGDCTESDAKIRGWDLNALDGRFKVSDNFDNNDYYVAYEYLFGVLDLKNHWLGKKIFEHGLQVLGYREILIANIMDVINNDAEMAAEKVMSSMGVSYLLGQLAQDNFIDTIDARAKKSKQVIGLPDIILDYIKESKQSYLTGKFKQLCAEDNSDGIALVEYYNLLKQVKVFNHLDTNDFDSFVSTIANIKQLRPDVKIPVLLRYLIKQRVYYSMCQWAPAWGVQRRTIDTFCIPIYEAREYRDYLGMCGPNGRLYPQNLVAAHNCCVRNAEINKDKALAERYMEKVKEFEPLCYEGKDYIITYPKTVEELIREGNELEHCVATYAKSIASGEARVFCVRKKDEPDVPFATVEVDSELNAIQLKGKYDIDISDKDVIEFVKEWKKKKGETEE